MYKAYITRLKEVRKHKNADRLQMATLFGNDIVIGLDYKEGDLGIYFPSDGKLGKEFAEVNNLVRKKDEFGNNIGGYLDPDKRHIRAIRLRDERSDGLWLPIKSLETFGDISKLKEGDTIDVFNGTLICEKYVPYVKPRRNDPVNNVKGKIKTAQFPTFKEHKDTEQLMYNLNRFKKGDTIYISLKMHGCFEYNTVVNVPSGRSKRIGALKKGDTVLGFKDGKVEPVKVLNTFNSGKQGDWLELELSKDGNRKTTTKIKCTADHPFFKDGEYVRADSLKLGDTLKSIKETSLVTDTQREVLIGTILGDGSIVRRGRSTHIEWSNKEEHLEYVNYRIKMLEGLAYRNPNIFTSGYNTRMIRAKTVASEDIRELIEECFENRNLNDNIIKYVTPLALAMLYMDDGSLKMYKTKYAANIAICSMSDEDVKILTKAFNNLGINVVAYVSKTNGKPYNRLRINYSDAKKFFELIREYVPECMQYKLPEVHRNHFNSVEQIPAHKGYKFIDQKVIGVKQIRKHVRYSIETESNNFFVNGFLVHNTSQRTGYLPKRWELKWYEKIIKKLFKIEPKLEYDYVTGTRRVVLESFDKDTSFYGGDRFRETHHNFFKGKLQKGETIYYEVVGYTDSGALIMPEVDNKKLNDKEFTKQYGNTTKYTYGCKESESDIYVYRMTTTNEDGHIVEYPTELVQARCEEMGVKMVPIFEKFIYTTKATLLKKVEQYINGPDPIGKTHVREGVVIRIDNKPTFTALKHKSFQFKVLEGIAKADAVEADMEESQ